MTPDPARWATTTVADLKSAEHHVKIHVADLEAIYERLGSVPGCVQVYDDIRTHLDAALEATRSALRFYKADLEAVRTRLRQLGTSGSGRATRACVTCTISSRFLPMLCPRSARSPRPRSAPPWRSGLALSLGADGVVITLD